MLEMLIWTVAIAFAFSCLVVVFLIASIKPQPRSHPQRRTIRRLTSYQKRLFNERVTKQLAGELLQLLNHDQTAATNLINQTILANPDKSLNQCFEKVIYEIQRSRG
ncbi:MAG TPA: hypothetical protein V6C63_20910 [Allocoleopsis sp.]